MLDWLIDWLIEYLIDWLITYDFTSHSRIFHSYGDVTIAGEGLYNLGLHVCSALKAFLYRATPAVTKDVSFSGLIRRTLSSPLRHTRGCGGSILTRILTDLCWNECILEKEIKGYLIHQIGISTTDVFSVIFRLQLHWKKLMRSLIKTLNRSMETLDIILTKVCPRQPVFKRQPLYKNLNYMRIRLCF
jgi:hypothetical protein